MALMARERLVIGLRGHLRAEEYRRWGVMVGRCSGIMTENRLRWPIRHGGGHRSRSEYGGAQWPNVCRRGCWIASTAALRLKAAALPPGRGGRRFNAMGVCARGLEPSDC